MPVAEERGSTYPGVCRLFDEDGDRKPRRERRVSLRALHNFRVSGQTSFLVILRTKRWFTARRINHESAASEFTADYLLCLVLQYCCSKMVFEEISGAVVTCESFVTALKKKRGGENGLCIALTTRVCLNDPGSILASGYCLFRTFACPPAP